MKTFCLISKSVLPLIFLLLFPSHKTATALTIKNLEGETLRFKVAFLWFKEAAEGSIEFRENKEGGYTAILHAETKGFIGWVTSYRNYLYTSHLYLRDDGKGFISSRFERIVKIKDSVKRTVNILNYKKRRFAWKKFRNGTLVNEKEEEIPPDTIYEDILSAFYNLRLGLYGKIEKGKDYKIKTIPDKGVKEISVHVATRKEEKEEAHHGAQAGKFAFLIFVNVPKALFNSKSGVVKIWFNKDEVPIAVVVEDYIGLGDIRGYLKEK